jgi:hypothetical protein
MRRRTPKRATLTVVLVVVSLVGASLIWPRWSVATPPSYTLAEMLNMARGSVDQAVHVNKPGVVKIDTEQPPLHRTSHPPARKAHRLARAPRRRPHRG